MGFGELEALFYSGPTPPLAENGKIGLEVRTADKLVCVVSG